MTRKQYIQLEEISIASTEGKENGARRKGRHGESSNDYEIRFSIKDHQKQRGMKLGATSTFSFRRAHIHVMFVDGSINQRWPLSSLHCKSLHYLSSGQWRHLVAGLFLSDVSIFASLSPSSKKECSMIFTFLVWRRRNFERGVRKENEESRSKQRTSRYEQLSNGSARLRIE